jgi:hypothetical protein
MAGLSRYWVGSANATIHRHHRVSDLHEPSLDKDCYTCLSLGGAHVVENDTCRAWHDHPDHVR